MAELCWGPMTRLGRGCFWELASPMWEAADASAVAAAAAPVAGPGGKAPTRPSLCHPWSDGVTAWQAL